MLNRRLSTAQDPASQEPLSCENEQNQVQDCKGEELERREPKIEPSSVFDLTADRPASLGSSKRVPVANMTYVGHSFSQDEPAHEKREKDGRIQVAGEPPGYPDKQAG